MKSQGQDLNIFVFSPYCLLRPTTNRIFDMRLCDAFAGHNERVSIVYPYTYMKDNIRFKDISACYGLENNVHTRMLFTPLREHSAKATRFIFLLLGFSISTILLLAGNIFSRKKLVFISRDAKSLLPALCIRKLFAGMGKWKVFFMAAEVKHNRIYSWVVKESDGVLAGVTTTREAIRAIVSIPEEKFLLSLAPVPVYKNDLKRIQAKQKIAYTVDKPLIVYTGKLGLDVHEVLYLLEAAAKLKSYSFLFTGGRQRVVEEIREYCKARDIDNVILTGFFEDTRMIRNYQLAADVLVSYYTSKDHMIEFNYPQKINEYLSTHNPVITPDFPATRDVLNEKNVLFVKPDDVQSLVMGIQKLVENKELSNSLAAQAFQDVQELTFHKRAGEFISFIRSH